MLGLLFVSFRVRNERALVAVFVEHGHFYHRTSRNIVEIRSVGIVYELEALEMLSALRESDDELRALAHLALDSNFPTVQFHEFFHE